MSGKRSHPYDYDLVVIGGGSGGMSSAKKAAELGAKVALFDFVKPSTQGTAWGLGGTCVNVGCVPKKLMHYAGLLGYGLHDADTMGWSLDSGNTTHDWEKLVETVTDHVKMLNFRYRNGLKNKQVEYINGLAEFGMDSHTIQYYEKGRETDKKTITTSHVVIAVGGRPSIPSDIPGALEHAITSDDLFTLDHTPGKTLCVGGSYIALECAGFLTELGYNVSVAVRTDVVLRGFDRQCANKVAALLSDVGTNIMYHVQVTSITKKPNGRYLVTFEQPEISFREEFDTVFFATGRLADTKGLNLARVGVRTNPDTGKVIVQANEETTVQNVFAIGDVCEGKPELTPVAVKAGELLANRLFGTSTQLMNYEMVATTIFTPFEYGSVGLSEELAVKRYGEADVEVYLSEFTTLELSALHRYKHKKHGEEVDMDNICLSKLVCVKSLGERVVGFHFVGPNAGEITQGFALAVKLGATKADFDDLVGIHPTDAESFCALHITKRSGINWGAAGGCGGGVCG